MSYVTLFRNKKTKLQQSQTKTKKLFQSNETEPAVNIEQKEAVPKIQQQTKLKQAM